MTLLLAFAALVAPDAMPALEAVKTCNRAEIRRLINAEPHRRAEFATAAYERQRAIADARAALVALPPADPAAPPNPAFAALDTQQRALDDARALERAWRELFDEVRADFLSNCNANRTDH